MWSLKWSLIQYGWCPSMKKKLYVKTETHRKNTIWKQRQKMRNAPARQLMPRLSVHHQKPKATRKGSTPNSQRKHIDTLVLNFCLPGQWGNKLWLFQAGQCVALCYNSPRKLIQPWNRIRQYIWWLDKMDKFLER